MRIGNLEIHPKDRKEKMQLIACAVMLPAAILMLAAGALSDDAADDAPRMEKTLEEPVVPPKIASTQTAAAAPATLPDYLMQNPFVEMSQLAKEKREEAASETRAERAQASLPAIPSIPAPSSVPLPAIPAAPVQPGQAPASSGPVTVQGILTGDGGENLAILSDGRVVSEGDSLGSDRIAYIGGDGIQFDNGHTIDYK